MASEIEELDQDNVLENALDQVLEKGTEAKKHRWEIWVAVSSSVLALLSLVAALLATFASDEATIASSDGTDLAVAAEAARSSHTVLKMKLDLLAAMDKPAGDGDTAELKRSESQARHLLERSKKATAEMDRAFKLHDLFAIAMTVFQLTMLFSGLAVMLGRIELWRVGLAFSTVGVYFFVRGLLGYMAHG